VYVILLMVTKRSSERR